MRNLAVCFMSLLFAVAVLGNAQAIQAQSKPQLADRIAGIRPSIVQVIVKIPVIQNRVPTELNRVPTEFKGCFGEGRVCIAGTGFFVNSNGDVVTAFHVMDGYRTRDGRIEPGIKEVVNALEAAGIHAELEIGVAIPNMEAKRITIAAGTRLFPAVLVASDPAHDLALIRPTVNPFTSMSDTFKGLPQGKLTYVSLSPTRPRDGEGIFACGYPFGQPGLITTSGSVASAWNTKVLLRAEAAGFSFPDEVYEADLSINPGNSGGPVFRFYDNALIGVAVEHEGTLSIVVPAKFVTAFLKSHNISWTAKSASERSLKPNR